VSEPESSIELQVTVGASSFHATGYESVVLRALAEFRALVELQQKRAKGKKR
jgi:hypothetical protein